jgi:hypothetical protein
MTASLAITRETKPGEADKRQHPNSGLGNGRGGNTAANEVAHDRNDVSRLTYPRSAAPANELAAVKALAAEAAHKANASRNLPTQVGERTRRWTVAASAFYIHSYEYTLIHNPMWTYQSCLSPV